MFTDTPKVVETYEALSTAVEERACLKISDNMEYF